MDQIFNDKQFDAVILNHGFDSVGWAQIRAYAETRQIVLEDLFVKPEYRGCGIGSKLLQEMEKLAFSNAAFREAANTITVPIPREDVWKAEAYQAVKQFFVTRGYLWKYESAMPRSPDYAVFLGEKKGDMNQGGLAGKTEARLSSPVLPVMKFTRPMSEANYYRYFVIAPIESVSLVYGKREKIQVTAFEGKRFLTGARFNIYDGVQIDEAVCPRRPELIPSSEALDPKDAIYVPMNRVTFN